MLIYTVHEPPRPTSGPPETIDERADALVFVKEGFSVPAFLLGPFWLAANRIWLALAAYVAAFVALQAVLWLIPGGYAALGGVMLVLSVGFGLEANSIRRWALDRRGYRHIGTAAGKTFRECEHRFLTGWLGSVPARTTSAATA